MAEGSSSALFECDTAPSPRPYADYGARLALLRKAAGLSQSALARAIGVQASAINHLEAGRVLPRADRLRTLAAALHVNPKQVVP